jgi:hypothetical protein
LILLNPPPSFKAQVVSLKYDFSCSFFLLFVVCFRCMSISAGNPEMDWDTSTENRIGEAAKQLGHPRVARQVPPYPGTVKVRMGQPSANSPNRGQSGFKHASLFHLYDMANEDSILHAANQSIDLAPPRKANIARQISVGAHEV